MAFSALCMGHGRLGRGLLRTTPMGMRGWMLANWINQHQQDVIEYRREENQILREKLGGIEPDELLDDFLQSYRVCLS